MNLTSYVAKQNQLETYTRNLHKLEDKIASYGGYTYAPLDVQNQYDDIKATIERLEQEIHQIELRMIQEIPTIRDVFRMKEGEIEQWREDFDLLDQSSMAKDGSIRRLSKIMKDKQEIIDNLVKAQEDIVEVYSSNILVLKALIQMMSSGLDEESAWMYNGAKSYIKASDNMIHDLHERHGIIDESIDSI